jgi:hypothetical protein
VAKLTKKAAAQLREHWPSGLIEQVDGPSEPVVDMERPS